ncbi:MAG: (2Fe-2S) ferredoxin domain-containing protein, partial [Nanoarchaeota archaeon]
MVFKFNTKNEKIVITVCRASSCKSLKSLDIISNLKDEISKSNLDWEVRQTGCHGFCEAGPVVVVNPFDILYTRVKPDDAADIVSSLKENKILERLLYEINGTKITQQK